MFGIGTNRVGIECIEYTVYYWSLDVLLFGGKLAENDYHFLVFKSDSELLHIQRVTTVEANGTCVALIT